MKPITPQQVQALADAALTERPATVPAWVWQLHEAESRPYYRFLHLLARATEPSLIVELGTERATATAFLATGHPAARVVSVDCEPGAIERLRTMTTERGLRAEGICGNTINDSVVASVWARGRVDLLFIDTDHHYPHIKKEYAAYAPLIAAGGLMAFDDIHGNDEMRAFWSEVPEPKLALPKLHWPGFGVSWP